MSRTRIHPQSRSEQALARFPIRWNPTIEKESPNSKSWNMFRPEKPVNFFKDVL